VQRFVSDKNVVHRVECYNGNTPSTFGNTSHKNNSGTAILVHYGEQAGRPQQQQQPQTDLVTLLVHNGYGCTGYDRWPNFMIDNWCCICWSESTVRWKGDCEELLLSVGRLQQCWPMST
jgi:hypothetical protein